MAGEGQIVAEDLTNESKEALTSFIERIEKLEEEKADLAEDIKSVYAELKGQGFEPKVVRRIIKDRKEEREALKEAQSLYEVYADALGML